MIWKRTKLALITWNRTVLEPNSANLRSFKPNFDTQTEFGFACFEPGLTNHNHRWLSLLLNKLLFFLHYACIFDLQVVLKTCSYLPEFQIWGVSIYFFLFLTYNLSFYFKYGGNTKVKLCILAYTITVRNSQFFPFNDFLWLHSLRRY